MSAWVWWAIGALVLAGLWFGWKALRPPPPPPPRPAEDAPGEVAVREEMRVPDEHVQAEVAAPVEVTTPVEIAAPVEVAPPAAVVPRPVVPMSAPVVAAPLVVAPRVEPAVVVEPAEEIVPVERAGQALWSAAISLGCAPEHMATLTGLLAPAVRAASPAAGVDTIFYIRFDGDEAIHVARGNASTLHDLAARRRAAGLLTNGGGRDVTPAAWLAGPASAALAGTALAAWARTHHLDALEGQLAEIKSALVALQPKLDAETLRRLKTQVQDLSRFLREARDNYATAIRKPVFLERVAEACTDVSRLWFDLQERPRAIRAQLGALADAPRYGEVQLERTLAQLRALHEERRVQALGARLVGALHGLRLSLGESVAPPGAPALDELCANWQSDADAESALLQRMAECERRALGPPYAGKGEFESNRAAVRALLDKLGAEAAEGAGRALADARAALAAGFLDAQAADWALLLRVDGDGRVAELRRCAAAAISGAAAQTADARH